MNTLIQKGVSVLKNEGITAFVKKTKKYILGKNNNTKKSIDNTLFFDGMRTLQAIPCINLNGKKNRLNIVTDSLEKNSLFGGVATALVIATLFCKKNSCDLRIITRTAPVNPEAYNKIMKITGITDLPHIEYYSDFDRDADGEKNYALEVYNEGEIFFATSWWSAYSIRKTFPNDVIYYILQEVETFFYPHGDEHLLCSQVLNDKKICFIVNSHFLFDYYKNVVPNVVEHGIFFEPAFPEGLYKPNFNKKTAKRKLFFYARPNNPRNLFHYGVDMINKAISTGILNTNEWDIYCLGNDLQEIRFYNGYTAINKGTLDWKEYGEFLSDIDLAVSLMYTPHPSYPPYDVLCSGGVVLTNKYANKQIFDFSKNAVLSSLDEKEFLKNFALAVEMSNDIVLRKKNYDNNTIARNWDETLKSVFEFIKEF